MSDVADRYETIADGFTERVARVTPDEWSSPSPCPDWTARDIATHVIDTHHRILATLDGSTPSVVGPDDDVVDRWTTATREVRDAVRDPDRASKMITGGPFGDQSFESLVGRLLCPDTLVHTWDLARATGQDDRLDPAGVAKALELLAPLDDAIRRPGGFGPKIEPRADADEQTRLLNFLGRTA
jgi:uncharacterized protein (TIGR03086 family)